MTKKIELPYSWHESSRDSKLTQIMEKLLEIEEWLNGKESKDEYERTLMMERRERGI